MNGFARGWRLIAIVAWMCTGFSAAADAQTAAPSEAPPASPSASSSPPPQASPSKQTGRAAWEMLVGNTIVAKTRNGGYSEFYGTDGVVKHLDRDGTSSGRWKIESQKICFDYPDEDDASCVSIELDGASGAFVDEDGSRDTFDVVPGNPKNL